MDKDTTFRNARASINELSVFAHDNALQHGFYDDIRMAQGFLEMHGAHAAHKAVTRDFILAQLAKVDSEVGEAVSAIQRNRDDEVFGLELADIIIRVLDLSGFMGLKIGSLVVKKMTHNETRPYKHGKTC